jgi:ubiquinone/menaquinone biosynthesis C-methylase UbiE
VYLACLSNQRQFVVTHEASSLEPIVDLASGRGDLVEALVRAGAGRRVPAGLWSRIAAIWSKRWQAYGYPIIASDFSPRILRRDRRWLEYFGLYDQVSLLAFDARRTPFKDGAISKMTTNLGPPNIDQPEVLLPELRRVVSGRLLAITQFYPEDDVANVAAIGAEGRSTMLFQQKALDAFSAAGWQPVLENICKGPAHPTPVGTVLEGVRIDGLPVADTILEWGVLVAS